LKALSLEEVRSVHDNTNGDGDDEEDYGNDEDGHEDEHIHVHVPSSRLVQISSIVDEVFYVARDAGTVLP
jgi:hypothetical protein